MPPAVGCGRSASGCQACPRSERRWPGPPPMAGGRPDVERIGLAGAAGGGTGQARLRCPPTACSPRRERPGRRRCCCTFTVDGLLLAPGNGDGDRLGLAFSWAGCSAKSAAVTAFGLDRSPWTYRPDSRRRAGPRRTAGGRSGRRRPVDPVATAGSSGEATLWPVSRGSSGGHGGADTPAPVLASVTRPTTSPPGSGGQQRVPTATLSTCQMPVSATGEVEPQPHRGLPA